MRECLNSEFGQGAEWQEERGQAIPLNYFKEGNEELTVTQKSGRKSCTHRQSELCAATVSSLGPPCPTGTFRHDLCPARCCSLRPLSGLTAEGLLLEELLWPPPVQALWAGSHCPYPGALPSLTVSGHPSPLPSLPLTTACVLCAPLLGPLDIMPGRFCHCPLSVPILLLSLPEMTGLCLPFWEKR